MSEIWQFEDELDEGNSNWSQYILIFYKGIQWIFKCFLIVLYAMKKQQIVLKNQQLKPENLTFSLGTSQTEEIPQICIKINRNQGYLTHNNYINRKYIFAIQELDEETPFLQEGDSYTFPHFSTPGTYHLRCLTFPKILSVIQIKPKEKGEMKNAIMMNLPGLEGLEAVEQEKEEEMKEDNNVNWTVEEENENLFGTPKKPEVQDFDDVLANDDGDENSNNKYLKYFKEEFRIWKNFFQKKQQVVYEPETPKKEKPKSEKRKNSDFEEKDEEIWTKRDKYSPYFTLSSGSPSNYENFSFDDKEKADRDLLLYSQQEVNDRQEEGQYEKIRTMKKTNSQYRFQVEQKDTEETQTLSLQPKTKHKKSSSITEWLTRWSGERCDIKIKRKEDSYLTKQYLQYLKNKYTLSGFLYI